MTAEDLRELKDLCRVVLDEQDPVRFHDALLQLLRFLQQTLPPSGQTSNKLNWASWRVHTRSRLT